MAERAGACSERIFPTCRSRTSGFTPRRKRCSQRHSAGGSGKSRPAGRPHDGSPFLARPENRHSREGPGSRALFALVKPAIADEDQPDQQVGDAADDEVPGQVLLPLAAVTAFSIATGFLVAHSSPPSVNSASICGLPRGVPNTKIGSSGGEDRIGPP